MQCPHPKWSLWSPTDNFAYNAWCCGAGQFGVILEGDGLACSSYGSPLGSSQSTAPEIRDPKTTCTSGSITISTGSDPRVTDPTDDEDGGPALEGGAIAGVVVGSIAGVSIIVAAAWWLLRRRAATAQDGEAAAEVKPTLPQLGGQQMLSPAELGDQMRDTPSELGGKESHSPAELGGTVGQAPTAAAESGAVYELPDNRA